MPSDKGQEGRTIAMDQLFEDSLVAAKGSINQGAIALSTIIRLTSLLIRERLLL
jgi:hypothetical protein